VSITGAAFAAAIPLAAALASGQPHCSQDETNALLAQRAALLRRMPLVATEADLAEVKAIQRDIEAALPPTSAASAVKP
jgi:hypothetical protein